MKAISIFIVLSLFFGHSCIDTDQKFHNDLYVKLDDKGVLWLDQKEVSNLKKAEALLNIKLDFVPKTDRPKVINFTISNNVKMGRVEEVKNLLKKFRDDTVVRYGAGALSTVVKLPPLSNEKIQFDKLKRRNLLRVKVFQDTILADGGYISLAELKRYAKLFLRSDPDNSILPEQKFYFFKPLGQVLCSPKSVIVLEHDPEIVYGKYVEVYDALKKNYEDLWEEYSLKYFEKKYDNLDEIQTQTIKKILPFVLSEV